MKLDDAQQKLLGTWIEHGLQPAEIQKRLGEELGIRLTYMEVRLLLDDLRLRPKDRELPAAPAPGPRVATPGGSSGPSHRPASANAPAEDAEPDLGGDVTVTVDQVTRPGSVVSGNVTFSDGKSADWYLDQMGRLGLAPKEQGYRPSQHDLLAFQNELQDELARLGF
jgi:hypothetical protein